MTALLLGTLAAGGLVTWAFLRPRGATRAVPYPSLQHLRSSELARRRRPALEDVPGWALRLAALACFGAGLAADHLDWGAGRLRPVVLVDPATGEAGWRQARREDAVAWLGFEGGRPRLEGPLGPWLQPALEACSASARRCLARAAVQSRRPVVAVGAPAGGWEGLEEVGQPVTWRLAAAVATEADAGGLADAGLATEAGAQATRVRLRGRSPEARLWAAALEEAGATAPGPQALVVVEAGGAGATAAAPGDAGPSPAAESGDVRRPGGAGATAPEPGDVRTPGGTRTTAPEPGDVRTPGDGAAPDRAPAPGGWPGPEAVPAVVVHAAPRPAEGWRPEVRREPVEGVLLDEAAAGAPGLVLGASLQFAPDEGASPLAGRVVVRRRAGGGPAAAPLEVAVAATAEELGRWAHEGQLPVLARTVLAALGPRPLDTEALPAPGSRYLDARGRPAPLGMLDVAPGRYLRSDGELRVAVRRPAPGDEAGFTPGPAPGGPKSAPGAPTPAPGGPTPAPGGPTPAPGGPTPTPGGTSLSPGSHAADAPAPWPVSLPALLLGLAAALLLAALARTRAAPSLAVGLAALALLGAQALDVARTTAQPLERVVRLDALDAGALAGALRAAGLRVASSGEALDCAGTRQAAPCAVVARLALAGDAPAAAEGLVFDPGQPRVDVLSVRLPSRLALGDAARVEVTVRVRRGAGRSLQVRARPAHGATVEQRREVGGEDAVLGLALAVVPLLPGEEPVAVEAQLDGAADAREARLTVEAREVHRVLLAGAPSWEARFAARALETQLPGRAASLTRVGAAAVRAAGLPRQDPLRWLADPAALATVDTLVLTGFAARELQGPPTAALRAFLARGGGVLALGAEPADALGWPGVAGAEGPRRVQAGLLLDGSPALRAEAAPPGPVTGPPGVEVLATLDGAPWVLGRAEGAGRLAVVRTRDLFRLSPPAGEGEAAERALFRALAWVEAAPARERAQAPGTPPAVTTLPRARLRADAARRGVPFLELEGAAGVARAFGALPPVEPRPLPVPLRRVGGVTALTLALLGLEALSRKLRRSAPAR